MLSDMPWGKIFFFILKKWKYCKKMTTSIAYTMADAWEKIPLENKNNYAGSLKVVIVTRITTPTKDDDEDTAPHTIVFTDACGGYLEACHRH